MREDERLRGRISGGGGGPCPIVSREKRDKGRERRWKRPFYGGGSRRSCERENVAVDEEEKRKKAKSCTAGWTRARRCVGDREELQRLAESTRRAVPTFERGFRWDWAGKEEGERGGKRENVARDGSEGRRSLRVGALDCGSAP